PEVTRFATAGIARLLVLLRDTEIMHPSIRVRHAQQSALITLVDRLVTAAAALEAVSLEPRAGERERLENVAAGSARVRSALDDDQTLPPPSAIVNPPLPVAHGSPVLPVIVELEHVLALIQQALAPEAIPPHAPEPERPNLFVADAFTNPEYVRYALKGALPVMICHGLHSAVDC